MTKYTVKKPKKYEIILEAIKEKFKTLRQEIPQGKSFQDTVEKDILSNFFPPSPTPNV